MICNVMVCCHYHPSGLTSQQTVGSIECFLFSSIQQLLVVVFWSITVTLSYLLNVHATDGVVQCNVVQSGVMRCQNVPHRVKRRQSHSQHVKRLQPTALHRMSEDKKYSNSRNCCYSTVMAVNMLHRTKPYIEHL